MSEDGAGVAVEVGTVGRPQDWDKAVSAAYFRALGASQATAAEAAGCSERSVRSWEASPWWPQAHREAVERWHVDLSAASRKSLLEAVRTDGDLALRVQERIDPRLSGKEVTVARVNAMLIATIGIIREQLPPDDAERILGLMREVWRW